MQNSLSNGAKKLFLPVLLTTAMIVGTGEISQVFGQKNIDEYGHQYGYKTERKNGKEILYFDNGKIHREGNINKDGRREGTFTTYYANGNKESEVNYIDGTLEGISTQWYKNGYIEKKGKRHNNKKNGLREKGYENGRNHWMGFYENGEEIGTRIFRDKEGQELRVDF